MCGIVSLISRKQGGLFHSDLEMMEQLLVLDTMRGPDSTGVFTVMRDKAITLTKVGSHPLHLFCCNAWTKHRSKAIASGRIMVGHNRKATLGAVNSTNAHPFHENNIVLVHNGTTRGDHKKLADTEVDSHAICHAFNEKGAEEVLKTLDAAFAFIWWDIAKERLYAVRNEERPLSIVAIDDMYAVVSEPWMAVSLFERNHKKVESVTNIEPGVLYEWTLNGTMSSKKIELRKPPVYTNNVTLIKSTPSANRNRFIGCATEYEDDDIDDVLPHMSEARRAFLERSEEALQSGAPFASDPNYTKGETVLCKLLAARASASGEKTMVNGESREPGKPIYDLTGYVDNTVHSKDVQDLLGESDLEGEITGFARSTCGPSLWLSNLRPAKMVNVHNGDIPERVWKYIVAEVRCKDCGYPIMEPDQAFTSVTRRATSEYRVTCADCVENKLPKGPLQDAFIQARLDAIQDGIAIREESAGTAIAVVKTEGGATIH